MSKQLKSLFDKLGHNLEEIRVRALQNILSKLEHNLICDADLVQEKHLHIKLLEWFNFPACPQQEQTLSLILRLSKHPSAASIYLDIGAVEFLTQLRPNVQASLHKVVDSILDNLFHLPISQHDSHRQECIYKQNQHKGTDRTIRQAVPNHLLQPSESMTEDVGVSALINPYPSPPDNQPVGYFEKSREEVKQTAYTPQTIPAASARCFKFSTFPWIALTPTDRHVLSSTDSSLKGKDMSLVISACEFLSDVVFQDFPAEVFLQRPSIVKSLLSLLCIPSADIHGVSLHPIKSLTYLTKALQSRIYFYQDPALYTPKQDFAHGVAGSPSPASFLSQSSSSDSRPSIIGHSGDRRHSGDGQDGDHSQHSSGPHLLEGNGIEHTDIEDIQSLQFMQWTTPQFCMAIIEKLLPCMKTPSERFIMTSIELLHQVIELLQESVAVSLLWDDGSVPSRELIDKFQDILEMVSDVMYLHYHGNLSLTTPQAEISQHRVAFMGLAVFVIQLLQAMVPVEKGGTALCEDFGQILTLMCNDESLSYSFPEVRSSALEYLQTVQFQSYAVFCQAQQIVSSLQNTCSFLMESEDPTDENIIQLISYAEDALHSLPYHLSNQYIERCVQLTSQICRKSNPNPVAVKQGKQIVLHLLAHPVLRIKQESYAAVLSIVKESLGISHVAEPTSSATQGVVFIIDDRLLYEITCFGMSDRDKQIQKIAEEILLYLLQSQLLLPSNRWQQLLESITAVLPVLQSFSSLETRLGKCILGLLDTDITIETGALPILERFRGTLRLMFSTETRLRAEGLGKLAWFLAHEKESLRKLPLFSELDVTNLTSVFIIEMPRSLLDEDTSRSVFQTESLTKVYNIFTSEQVQDDVRKSAGEQLAIILQAQSVPQEYIVVNVLNFLQLGNKHARPKEDSHEISYPALQPLFLEKDGLDHILKILGTALRKPEEDVKHVSVNLLPAVVKILRAVVQYNHGIRHSLAHQPHIYYLVLRCGLLFHKDYNVRQEVAELLTFLLFDEVAKVVGITAENNEEPITGFSLPAFITKKYRLPFKPPTHHSSSPFCVSLPPDTDPLTAGSLAEMLRFTWNVAWHNGIEEAIKQIESTDKDESDQHLFSPKLKLTPMDLTILKTTYIPFTLKDCVHSIENAVSHDMVGGAVLRLCSNLVVCGPNDVSQILHRLNWREAVHRFLLIIPSSNADEQLLSELLQILCHVLVTKQAPPNDTVTWIGDVLHNHQGALLGLLGRPDNQGEDTPETVMVARRQLNRQLLKFVKVYVGKCAYSLIDRTTFECVRGDLTKNLLTRINRTDAAHFYNLASLESTLLALMHVTARPGWSQGSIDTGDLSLCMKMLQSLLEIVSAFHIGRGGMSMSYMGRGVTRCATVCLRHLAFEMATQLDNKDWPRKWLFSRQATEHSIGESGFHWLIPLWMYRDPEVRAAGLGIATALTSTEAGRITITTQCQHIPGGVWGATFSILLDQSECSLVRQQAALLLINMTSQAMPSGSVESSADVWQGPIVRNAETQISLVGLTALLALLHHSSFYQEMLVLLSNYYPQPAIHPVSVAPQSTAATPMGSLATLTTSGTLTPAGTGQLHGTTSQLGISSTPGSGSRPVTMGNNGGHGNNHSQGTIPDLSGHSSTPDQGLSSRGATMATTGTNTPASMLGSQPHDTSTPASTVADTTVQEYQSVVTPCLVSAVCKLLCNLLSLAPEDTLACIVKENIHKVLISMLDTSLLDAYIAELVTTPYQKQYLLAFIDLIHVYEDMMHFLTQCIVLDKNLRQFLLSDKVALRQIVLLLGVSYQENFDLNAQCESLWQSVFTLLTTLYQVDGPEAYAHCTVVLVKHWQTIAARIVTIVQEPRQAGSPLWLSALHFLSMSLTEESKSRSKCIKEGDGHYYILHRLDTAPREEEDIFSGCSGNFLCQALLKAYDTVLMKPLDQCYNTKIAVMNALKSLLCLSNTAKMTALENGLVETITEHTKHLQHKLTMDALELSKPQKKKESPHITELIFLLDLLRNFMYEQGEIKVAAYECGLSNLLHKCWAWCQMEPSLMSCVLSLLSTYTARCPKACSSLAFTSAMSLEDKMTDKPLHSSNSLVHCVIKLVNKEVNSGNMPVLRLCFGLLSTLSLSQECRGILWKSNFLNEFCNLTPKKSKKSKAAFVIEGLWLDLMVNLSFSTEGQNILLRIQDSLGLLLEFGSGTSENNQRRSVLILRNLCFHAANKPKLLANEKLLPFFLQCIEEGSLEVQTIACSALVALLYNNQKAKVSMKSSHVLKKLQDSYNQFVNMTGVPGAETCAKSLADILQLLKC